MIQWTISSQALVKGEGSETIESTQPVEASRVGYINYARSAREFL